MPIPLQDGWLYGPVSSRRYGRSLGINPLPLDRKLCSLDCLYCQYGYTRAQNVAGRAEVPSVADLAAACEREFARLAAAGDRPDRITVAGNGEPTLHPDFLELSRALVAARDRHFPGAVLGILSNSMHLDRDDVVTALDECYDEPAMKLEWGSAEVFAALNQVSPKGYRRVLDGLARLRSFVVQALFLHSRLADNASPAEVAGWIDNLLHLRDRIRWIEIYTLDRPPAAASHATPLTHPELESIAHRARLHSLDCRLY